METARRAEIEKSMPGSIDCKDFAHGFFHCNYVGRREILLEARAANKEYYPKVMRRLPEAM